MPVSNSYPSRERLATPAPIQPVTAGPPDSRGATWPGYGDAPGGGALALNGHYSSNRAASSIAGHFTGSMIVPSDPPEVTPFT